ncbi:MAG: type II toxin-antitoxin system RelE/ParE family toxin [Gammaproteobacteria bacterium]
MVIWSDPAKADLRAIHDFIAHDSEHYAKQVTQDMVAKTDSLDELPRIGKVLPELGDDNLRELHLYSYRILYEIKPQGVFVLAVIHKRREFDPQMIER